MSAPAAQPVWQPVLLRRNTKITIDIKIYPVDMQGNILATDYKLEARFSSLTDLSSNNFVMLGRFQRFYHTAQYFISYLAYGMNRLPECPGNWPNHTDLMVVIVSDDDDAIDNNHNSKRLKEIKETDQTGTLKQRKQTP